MHAVDSSIYSSLFVKRQIEDLGLLVKFAFVGSNFEATVRYLETQSKAIRQGEKSYLLFHYTPSLITHIYNLTSIKFDPCEQPWTSTLYHLNGSYSPSCLYDYSRFAKVSTYHNTNLIHKNLGPESSPFLLSEFILLLFKKGLSILSR